MRRMQIMRGSIAAALVSLYVLATSTDPTRAAEQSSGTPKPLPSATLNLIAGSARRVTPVRHPAIAPAIITGSLLNGGGPVQTAPVVYVVYWGWNSDPSGEQSYLNDFLSTIGGTAWLNTVTQYSGAGNPTNLYAGSWSDPSSVPVQPTDAQIQAEALAAAGHFGLGTSLNIQIIVATPSGHSTSGFGTSFCAYHGALAARPNITYTNLPYMTDAGGACGANSVQGPTDGVSIVAGHELAESITDPLLNAWKDAGGNEIGDKCAWTNLSTVTTSLGTFAVQPLWSNAANGCTLSTTTLQSPDISDVNGGVACPSDVLNWTSVAGATSYQVWSRQQRPSPAPSYNQIFSGTALRLRITLSQNAAFSYEAAACNASGCSPLSSPVLVTEGICP